MHIERNSRTHFTRRQILELTGALGALLLNSCTKPYSAPRRMIIGQYMQPAELADCGIIIPTIFVDNTFSPQITRIEVVQELDDDCFSKFMMRTISEENLPQKGYINIKLEVPRDASNRKFTYTAWNENNVVEQQTVTIQPCPQSPPNVPQSQFGRVLCRLLSR